MIRVAPTPASTGSAAPTWAGGLIYVDDSQVTDLLCRKRDVDADLRLEENASSVVLAALAGRDEFLHVVVADAPSQEVGAW